MSLQGWQLASGWHTGAQLRVKDGGVSCASGLLSAPLSGAGFFLLPSSKALISVLAPDGSLPWGPVTAPSPASSHPGTEIVLPLS